MWIPPGKFSCFSLWILLHDWHLHAVGRKPFGSPTKWIGAEAFLRLDPEMIEALFSLKMKYE